MRPTSGSSTPGGSPPSVEAVEAILREELRSVVDFHHGNSLVGRRIELVIIPQAARRIAQAFETADTARRPPSSDSES